MKRIISIILLVIMLTFSLTVFATEADDADMVFDDELYLKIKNEISQTIKNTNLEFNAKSVILVEASTGLVLFEHNADEKLAPASVTKIMTMLLAMEAIDSGKIKVDDMVQCSEYAASMGGSQVYLEPGELMSVNDLLKAIAVASGNDASVMLAEYIAGSAEGFIELMNKRAKELGMTNTNFVNCTGLEDANHRTTARDLSLCSLELIKHERIFEYTTIWMDTLRDGKFGLANTNKLIRHYEGANGLKTGSTDTALFCLSAAAKRNDMQLIAVVLGSPTSKERFAAASKLLDYGFANYAVAKDIKKPEIPKVKVIGGVITEVEAVAEEYSGVLVKKGQEDDIVIECEVKESINAPVEKGEVVGKMTYKLGEEVLGEFNIIVKENVAKIGFWGMFKHFIQSLYK